MSLPDLQSPPAASERKHAADDYARTPEGPPWMQLIDGEYHLSDSATLFHQTISRNLCLLLTLWTRHSGAGSVWCAPFDVYLSPYDVVQPDLLFLSKQKFGLRRKGRIFGPPDLVVEILSPSSAALDLGPKRALYARSGVPEMWAVDPDTRRVSVFRFAQDPANPVAILVEGQALASPLLPGFAAPVADLFAP